MSGISAAKSAAPTPNANTNGSGSDTNANANANANGAKKPNSKKPAASDKGNGKANGGGGDGLDNGAAPARTPPPGFASPAKAPAPNAWASNAAPAGFSDSQQRLLRHRSLFVFRSLVGKAVEVALVDASRFVGILDCVDPDDFSIVLKNTQRKGADVASEAEFNSGSTVIFKRRQLAHMVADGVVNYSEGAAGLTPASTAAAGFRTDTEISNRSHEHLYGRELESAAAWLDPQLDSGDLEDARRRKSGWNQFDANEKLFGVVSSYDENLYTTKLDKTKISNEKSRAAERLAREIERETTGNFHLQEERGQAVKGGDDLDEEAKYSSVDRKQQSQNASGPRNANAYVPPALRSATSSGPPKARPVSPKTPAPGKGQTATPVATKATSAPTVAPFATNAVAATPSPAQVSVPTSSPAEPTPTPTSDSQPRKPISFSEAVTGRSAARPSPILAPSAPSSTKAPKAEPKKQISPKTTKASSVATKSSSPGTAKKDAKAPSSKNQSEKKGTAVPNEKMASDTKPVDEAKADKKPKVAKAPAADQSPKPTSTEAPATAPATPAPAANATPAAAAKATTTLNPKAKEFKLSAAATSFTPKFASSPAAAPVTASPYRQPHPGHYGHMHPPPPHPSMGGMGYGAGSEEWMYDGMMLDETEYASTAAHAYMGYGMPMIPNPAMMQQPMYAPMMPPQQNARMGRSHGGNVGGYGYNQPGGFNQRGYYGQGAVPGAVPYHPAPAAMPGVPGIPQPPLPPTPADSADAEEAPISPNAPSGTQRHGPSSKQAPSKK